MNRVQLGLFSFTLFLSAALMFGLQPMIGKMLLPIVGGTPSGWIVAMAFFQVMLLAGYFVAHALSRFTPRVQGILYLACLGLGIIFLPARLADHTSLVSENPMAFDVFKLLTATVAIPFIALSATASTLQRLFMTTGHKSAEDPYFLYAASNLGSFAGLLLYPFLIEPQLTLTLQSKGWMGGYLLLIGFGLACLMLSGKTKAAKETAQKPYTPVSWKRRSEWIILSFIPSGLLLAVTTHITTDIFSVPLLWILPLSIYLLTFVVAFSKKSIVRYEVLLKLQPAAVAAGITLILIIANNLALSWHAMTVHLIIFGIVALMCHMRLARSRPTDDPRHLTDFYLMLAIGGALGGIVNAFVAPALLDRLIEYPLMLVLSCLLNEDFRKRVTRPYTLAVFAAAGLACILAVLFKLGMMTEIIQSLFILVAMVLIALHPKVNFVVCMALFLGVSFYSWQHPALMTARNFYGVIKVYENMADLTPTEKVNIRYMKHGTTLHGMQILDKKYETTPTIYYTREGPLGDLIWQFQPKNIAAVGLGTGTANCFGKEDRNITFFDIDPDVVKLAKEQFTYLSKCAPKEPRIIIGDARLELKKLENEKFDFIILDAFSSDTIPTHLLTKEAIEVYLDRLTEYGVIAFHISNRYFRLDGPITAAAMELGLQNATIFREGLPQPYAVSSRWIALARSGVDLTPLGKKGWVRATLLREMHPWTDDYTNLLDTMNF